ncbi:MAG: YbhB/YbcL family Raf kinase inhibitor-like protein [Burkholderiaceae bacterium]
MKLSSKSFADNSPMPERCAFGKIDPQTHIALSNNVNPHLAWSGAPEGTQSFVVICHDPDVPGVPDNVNQEGKSIAADLPRVVFYHWALVDIPAATTEIAEGGYSDGITPRGKAGPLALDGTRQGINDYTQWFAADRDMNGDYFGYDGPCPPWNDTIPHRYVFTVYALNIPAVPLEGRFTGADVVKAIQGHILAQASITGRYSLNPGVKA